jgi:glycine oxidase
MERAGFDATTTAEGKRKLERTAAEIVPALAHLKPSHAWAGIRPISADLQPILGADPDDPRLVYATGHSRNGVLMTPLTADCVAAILADDIAPADLSAFAADRFSATST